ncbi:hypothetical protein FGO68_gene5965 [Halteria grandinella]|uniref:UBC core domain-containing protein n=1 Tax=Halteria grandinella TaxID=5974 RepID=A0A8J8NIA7_HALGN|nr:hypothetical protein FGO68_gene5965 [Halteria grandinella]
MAESGKTEEEIAAVVKQGKKAPGQLRVIRDLGDTADFGPELRLTQPDLNNFMLFNLDVDINMPDSIWRKGKYRFTISIPNDYPHTAPKVHCDTQIYHPNIDMQGNVCLNILRADWKPVLGLSAICLGLQFLFIEPNSEDPLNLEAAQLMRSNPSQFKEKVSKTLRGGTYDGKVFPKFI